MGMLWSVLSYSMKDLVYFTLMLLILLAAFSMMSLQFFGSTIEGYSSLMASIIELILVLLGQFDVEGMVQASPSFGLIFFFLYIVSIVLIMMNVFLAILGEAYTVVRSENDEIAKAQVKTKSLGVIGYLKHVRAVLKARMAKRRERRLGLHGGGKVV
jgi:hypothetical protein